MYGENTSTTIKLTWTTTSPTCTGSLIIPQGTTILSSKPISGESHMSRSSGFKFSPQYISGYIISALLPWSTSTLLTSQPPILIVTTRASSCGWRVPYLSSSKNLRLGVFAIRFSPFVNKSPCHLFSSTYFSFLGDLFVLPCALHINFIN